MSSLYGHVLREMNIQIEVIAKVRGNSLTGPCGIALEQHHMFEIGRLMEHTFADIKFEIRTTKKLLKKVIIEKRFLILLLTCHERRI